MMRAFFLSILALFSAVASAQQGEAYMVVEANSGKVLMAANSVVQRPVASLTKIATCVIAVDWADATGTDLSQVTATVPPAALAIGGPNPLNLQVGDSMSVRDALYSAMLGSDNIAAMTVANYVGGEMLRARGKTGDPVAAFVGEMNELGKAIGLLKTRFGNPHGLEVGKQRCTSTAADIAKLSIYAMRKPGVTFISRQKERQVTVNGAGGKRGYKIQNTNELIGEPNILGLKTGTTGAAGPCVSVSVERDPLVREKADGEKAVTPRRLIIVVLNNPDRFNRARGFINPGWAAFDRWVAAGAPIENKAKEILDVPNPR
ncbi:D-alanyl-D-alanine carboxypeptidase family protein [Luteolibacter luteus]|uniref:D-alanyl-D-alanine carboxypeptidase n=1 Tax=Luteolibacter luteus TaxID=2728835 RepID=A0A858RRN0_9BACT|nr:serine hydrolase [Luteolibacter luteus]QJE98999.1 D-alanyl-D-alanine carboxypeptidase [Luteolibacter luteus]